MIARVVAYVQHDGKHKCLLGGTESETFANFID